MIEPAKRVVHLHLVDISGGWHICKSLTLAEFSVYRQTQVYTQDQQALETFGDLSAAAVTTLQLLSDGDVMASDSFAMNGFMLFASFIEETLRKDGDPRNYRKGAGDWLLAVASPHGKAHGSGATILLSDFIERTGDVPLGGIGLDHAVLSLLHNYVSETGFKTEELQVAHRWAETRPGGRLL